MRLDKRLAQSAGLSRSEARAAIKAGRVSLDGLVVRAFDHEAAESYALTLDGQALLLKREWHLMLNKPSGLLTAARDSRAATVMDLLPPLAVKLKCMPVGRLDKDTEGLLMFTTDGELAHRLLSPRRGIAKVYEALVEGGLSQSAVEAFASGITLSDFTALPARLTILSSTPAESRALVTLSEGKHRQVRRMFGSLGHEVKALKRLAFGPLALDGSLAPGQYRELRPEEINALKEAVRLV